jgi:hypothetical protein
MQVFKNKAIHKVRNSYINYIKAKVGTEDQELKFNTYRNLCSFCLDTELLISNEIEVIEFEAMLRLFISEEL